MTPAGNGGGCDKKKANLRANSIDFADREENGGKKKSNNCADVIYGSPLILL